MKCEESGEFWLYMWWPEEVDCEWGEAKKWIQQ